ncbi:MAG TPA: dipeptide epimerase [Rubrobacteraceae bacterium]|nr:dipeptide epimerase [Rubrobacteraceae bacterium]
MRITVEKLTVHTRRTFAIARGAHDAFERVILTLEEDGATGRGEAAPTAYYEQDAAGVEAALRRLSIPDPWDIEGALRGNAHLPPAALAALDAALHDLAAKRLGVPVWRLLGLARPAPVSAYTLAIADLDTTVSEARKLSGYPILKMKVGGRGDIETVRAVAAASEAEPWVDANEAFTPDEVSEAVAELREIGAAMIEQPVPASAGPEALRRVTEAASPVPVIADESAITAADVPKLAGSVSGVNVKLAKCGGIRRALEMVHTARAHGMLVMLGCMVETSLGIAAAAQVSGLFDYLDLDGAMLLADDPYAGLEYKQGHITVPDSPGLGVEPR